MMLVTFSCEVRDDALRFFIRRYKPKGWIGRGVSPEVICVLLPDPAALFRSRAPSTCFPECLEQSNANFVSLAPATDPEL